MGNFDILNYIIKCPKCKKQREWEIQFKDLVDDNKRNIFEDYPQYYKINDIINKKIDIIVGIGCCPICKTTKSSIIQLKNNRISDEYILY